MKCTWNFRSHLVSQFTKSAAVMKSHFFDTSTQFTITYLNMHLGNAALYSPSHDMFSATYYPPLKLFTKYSRQ